MLDSQRSSFETYCRERKAMVDKARHPIATEVQQSDAASASKGIDQQLELLEVISSDEKATAVTHPLTPVPSHSWSLSSNSIVMNTYPGDDEGNDHHECPPQQSEGIAQEGFHTTQVETLRTKAILSYSSDSSGLFSPLYEVTSEHTNVFQSTRRPLPKPGKTPRFGNLTYKQDNSRMGDDSLQTERTTTSQPSTSQAPIGDGLSFDFSTEKDPVSPSQKKSSQCGSGLIDACETKRKNKSPTTIGIISPVRTFEAFMRGEWQLDRVTPSLRSSSTEVIVPEFVDVQDENRRDDEVNDNQDNQDTREEDYLDAIIEVKDSVDADGNDIIVISEICPHTLQEANRTMCGGFGVDLQGLRHNKPVIDLTCCTDSEAMSFKMSYQSKFDQILSAQRELSFNESPSSFVYNLLSDTSRHNPTWNQNALLGQLNGSKHPLLVLSEHFRDMNHSFYEHTSPRDMRSPRQELPIQEELCQDFTSRCPGWSLQRSRNGMVLVYQHPDQRDIDDHAGSSTSTELATASSGTSGDSSQNCDIPPGQFQEAADGSLFDSEVIDDTELRAVMKITNDGEDVSIIFPSVSFDTIAEEESDDGLGHEMDALLELQTQLQSAMDVATTLTPSRFSIELTSPFAEHIYSQDSSMASFGAVRDSDSTKELPCKRGTPRRRVQFNDDVQEFLYVNEISDEPPKTRSYRKRSFVRECIGICGDVAEELSYSCVALSSICRVRKKPPNSKDTPLNSANT